MSVKVMGGVWELDLDPAKKLVLLAMADHADHEGGSIHPKLDTVAMKTGYTPRQVFNILRALERSGLLVRTGGGRGRGNAVHYRIDLTAGVRRENMKSFHVIPDENMKRKHEIHDIPAPENMKSETGKHEIPLRAHVDKKEPSREPSTTSTSNGAAADFRPTYVTELGAFYPKLLDNFQALDPIEFSDGAMKTILGRLERGIGPLPRDALKDALRAGHEALKRALVAEAKGGRPIQNLRGLTLRILDERLQEARHVTHS